MQQETVTNSCIVREGGWQWLYFFLCKMLFRTVYPFLRLLATPRKGKPLEIIPISEWDNIAAREIKAKRRLTCAEVKYPRKRVYRSGAFSFLTEGEEENDYSIKTTSVARMHENQVE